MIFIMYHIKNEMCLLDIFIQINYEKKFKERIIFREIHKCCFEK